MFRPAPVGEPPREVGALQERPATIGKIKRVTGQCRSGGPSGQFVFSVRDNVIGESFLGKNMMCRHRISRPLTLLTLWRRSGGVEVALEPTWTQRADQYQKLHNQLLAGSLRPQRLPSGVNVSTTLQVRRESQRTTNSMPTHHILA